MTAFTGKSLAFRLAELAAEAGDDPEIKLRKALLLRVSFLIILAAALWGVLYLIFSEPLAGAIPLSYSAFSLLTLLGFLATRRYDLYLTAQLVLILLLPFLLMVALGGFVNSSAVVLWSVLCPMAALVFDRPEKAPRWMLLYAGLLILGGALQPYVRLTNNLPPTMIVPLFFVLNLGTVSGIAFFLLFYFVREKDRAYRMLNLERERADQLLLNVLPKEVAPRLKQSGQTIAEHFDSASVLFADIVGSTTLFADMEPREIVDWLNEVFSAFDVLLDKYGLEKIRTIGDSYMVAAGVPSPRPDHARALALMALEMCEQLQQMPARNGRRIAFRMGMNSGPMVGGVIGKTKFHYDLWGDTVNTASRMESHGEAGKIQVTQQTYDLLRGEFDFEPRGLIPIKGKGELQTWFLLGRH
ncbi:MAG TPA: adenylate/guanylate cyclase domain-containing protein [Anaerolineales bacterium]|nr:adenylate/guanylate cyclase domain-containing protein [Anaerolineales bacterium]